MNRSKWSSNAGMTTVGSILWNTKGYDYYSQPWEFASNPRSLVSYQADLPDQTGGIVGGLNMVAYTDNFSKYDYINELIRTTSQLYGQSSLVQGANNGSDKMIVESNLFSQFTNTITSNIDWPNYLSSNGCAQPGDTFRGTPEPP